MCQRLHIYDRISVARKVILKYTFGSSNVLDQSMNPSHDGEGFGGVGHVLKARLVRGREKILEDQVQVILREPTVFACRG